MTKNYFTPVAIAMVALVTACSSSPKTTSLLEQARSDYRMAQINPGVVSYAALELRQAGDALALADASAAKNDNAEKIDQLAYLSRQQTALTLEVAKKKTAEAEVANSAKDIDQILLAQRTNEANQAKISADQSRLTAQIAQGQTAEAQRQADEARRVTEEAQRQAQQAQARNTQLEAQLADLAAKKTDRGLVITLGDVLFGTDQARLNPEGIRTAQKLADVLQQNPLRKVLVEGFTDSTGTTAYNQELSERRATAVFSALQGMGVARDRVATRGYGEAYPVAANDTSLNRQMNRRVEIVLSDDTGRTTQR